MGGSRLTASRLEEPRVGPLARLERSPKADVGAGKDRTGLGVALLHQLVGVHVDDMMADYLLTNTAGSAEARVAAGADSIRRSQGTQISDGAIRTLMSVAPDYIDAALRAVRRHHGSVIAYGRDVLGLDEERLAALRERLVVTD